MKASVQDAMTTEVVAVKVGASFKEMTARLRQSRVSAFPVIDDDGKVIGVVSEADMLASQVLSTSMLHRGEQEKAEGLTAGDLMTHPAITVSPEDPVEVAARLMYTLQVKRLPVIDPSGRLGAWARGFVRSNPTDTSALLADLNRGVAAQISYQSREAEGTQTPAETLNRGWGSCRDLAVLLIEAARSKFTLRLGRLKAA